MAGLLRNVFLRTLTNHHSFLRVTPILTSSLVDKARWLYTDSFLMMPGFVESRKQIADQFGHMRTKFFDRMKNHVEEEKGMVFTEDLKNVTYLASDSDEDLELLSQMIKRYNSQNQQLRFGSFVFGPVVCRLLYHFNKADLAIQMITGDEHRGFFDQLTSYLIVCNLLYKQGRYQDIILLWDDYSKRGVLDQKFPRDVILIVMAALYKINTLESYKKAESILKQAREAGSPLTRRSILFYSALALSQKQPAIALEALSISFQQTNTFTPNPRPLSRAPPLASVENDSRHVPVIANLNIKSLSLSEMKRFDEAIITMRAAVHNDRPFKDGCILTETVDTIKKKISDSGDKEVVIDYEETVKLLHTSGQIKDQSLDELLNEPIEGFTGARIDFIRSQKRSQGSSSRDLPLERGNSSRRNKPESYNVKRSGLYAEE